MTLYIENNDGRHVGWLLTKEQALKAPEYQRGEGVRSRELMTMPYTDYLETPEWNVTRKDALKAAGYRCQLCNADGPLEVHHRTYDRRGVEIPSDVIALCSECHEAFHAHRELAEKAGK